MRLDHSTLKHLRLLCGFHQGLSSLDQVKLWFHFIHFLVRVVTPSQVGQALDGLLPT